MMIYDPIFCSYSIFYIRTWNLAQNSIKCSELGEIDRSQILTSFLIFLQIAVYSISFSQLRYDITSSDRSVVVISALLCLIYQCYFLGHRFFYMCNDQISNGQPSPFQRPKKSITLQFCSLYINVSIETSNFIGNSYCLRILELAGN